MPKYLLLKHYRGGPEAHHAFPPLDQWAPQDVEAHFAFLKHVGELLEKNGELVDVQAVTPAQTWVRYGGPDAAPVTTDGPLPETSDLVAGWYLVDVESRERALEIAAHISSQPRPGGGAPAEGVDVGEGMSQSSAAHARPGRRAAARVDRRARGHVQVVVVRRLTRSWPASRCRRGTRARCALSSRECSRAWSGAARTSTPPRTHCRRRCSRRCGHGPSIRRATRVRG